jgi:polysaccharide deacetylase 2 family uncharacterized protein YibQ
MTREIVKGITWGIVVCVLMVVAVSLIAPPPLAPVPGSAGPLVVASAGDGREAVPAVEPGPTIPASDDLSVVDLPPVATDAGPAASADRVPRAAEAAPGVEVATPSGPESDAVGEASPEVAVPVDPAVAEAAAPEPPHGGRLAEAPHVAAAAVQPGAPAEDASVVGLADADPVGAVEAPEALLEAEVDAAPDAELSPPAEAAGPGPVVALAPGVPAVPRTDDRGPDPTAAEDRSPVHARPVVIASADGAGVLPSVDASAAALPEATPEPAPAAVSPDEVRAPEVMTTEDAVPGAVPPATVAAADADGAPAVGHPSPPVPVAVAGAGTDRAAVAPAEAAPLRIAEAEGPETSDGPAPLGQLLADLPPDQVAPVAPDLGLAPAEAAEAPPLDLAQAYPRRVPRSEAAPAPGLVTPVQDDQTPAAEAPAAEAPAAPAAVVAMPGKRVGRLPTIGEAEVAEPVAPVTPEKVLTGKAVIDNAVAFDDPGGLPRMALVLLDVGGDPVAAPAAPVTFAVDASRPDAAEAVAAYRAGGHEVVAMAPLPKGAAPSDAAVTLSVYMPAIAGTVAVIEAEPGGLQPDGQVAAQVVTELGRSGHGLIAWDSGLNQARQVALRQGLPFGEVFRDIDGAGQDAAAIRRFLDQAAFRAAQSGSLILVARATPSTVEAVDSWLSSPRARSVVMAPVSAVLTGG